MKLYMYPTSTTCQPVLLFCAEHDLKLDHVVVDLMSGAHMQEDFIKINPMHRVPVLEDMDLMLTESSAILKYLAEKANASSYPRDDLKQRSRINERMDWFITGFYMDYGYNLVYPQILPHLKRELEAVQCATLVWGKEKSAHWLQLLNDHWIGSKNNYVCGDKITLADYLGSGFVTLGELIGQELDSYPNVARWIQTMKSLPSWGPVHEAFDAWAASLQGQPFMRAP